MATFERIPAGKAPPRPASTKPSGLQARMRVFERYAAEVGDGEVGVLEPEHSETTRGLAMRMSRAAGRLGRILESWPFEGKLYFKVESPAVTKPQSKRPKVGKKLNGPR